MLGPECWPQGLELLGPQERASRDAQPLIQAGQEHQSPVCLEYQVPMVLEHQVLGGLQQVEQVEQEWAGQPEQEPWRAESQPLVQEGGWSRELHPSHRRSLLGNFVDLQDGIPNGPYPFKGQVRSLEGMSCRCWQHSGWQSHCVIWEQSSSGASFGHSFV